MSRNDPPGPGMTRDARVIRTLEELEALPVGTILADADGWRFQKTEGPEPQVPNWPSLPAFVLKQQPAVAFASLVELFDGIIRRPPGVAP